MGICPKLNVIARLEYELAYYDFAVHRFNHYITRTPPKTVQCFRNVYNTVMECVESDRHLGGNKIKVYQAVVLPTLLYGFEKWTTYQRHIKKLNHFHTTCLRKILWITWQKHIPDTEVLHHLDAMTALLGRSCCSHERSRPPEESALRRIISGQALPRGPEKALQRHSEGLNEIFRYRP